LALSLINRRVCEIFLFFVKLAHDLCRDVVALYIIRGREWVCASDEILGGTHLLVLDVFADVESDNECVGDEREQLHDKQANVTLTRPSGLVNNTVEIGRWYVAKQIIRKVGQRVCTRAHRLGN